MSEKTTGVRVICGGLPLDVRDTIQAMEKRVKGIPKPQVPAFRELQEGLKVAQERIANEERNDVVSTRAALDRVRYDARFPGGAHPRSAEMFETLRALVGCNQELTELERAVPADGEQHELLCPSCQNKRRVRKTAA